jgi:hypothetical protein
MRFAGIAPGCVGLGRAAAAQCSGGDRGQLIGRTNMPEGKPVIVVECEGGLVRSVWCSEPAEVHLLDHDEKETNDEEELREYIARAERCDRLIDSVAIHEVY